MANKLLILVFGAVIVTSLVVGGLLGMQFAGGGGDEVPATATPAQKTAAQAATTTGSSAQSTESTTDGSTDETATSEPTATPEPTFSPESVNGSAVEQHLRVLVNEKVRNGSQPLDSEATLEEMAQFHTDNMLQQGYSSHVAGGYSTRMRYEEFDRYSHCRVPSDSNAGIRDGEELEVVGRISLDWQEDPTDQEIARQLLDDLRSEEKQMQKLGLTNAETAGVGISVSDEARVYVTVDLC
ncbi:hypothetical protein ACFPYI_00710 [Halomarina salina]|uniref:SCP domain-containing protein n=1 Tax=Halomarina salina TaxID=1872699 RepID=A0ABD5RHC8_9EURY|nr:hypothetical protein [Halomarina salina]